MNIEKKTDGRKNNGGSRGGGRKPIVIEENVKLAIRQAVEDSPEALTRIWKEIIKRAEKGSHKHIQILFNYYYGKPVETVNVTSKSIKLTYTIVHE